MTLKLYYDLLSQPCRTLYIFLKVCNIPFEGKLVNLAKGEHLTPEYKKIHPFQKVPAVEHDGFNMIESAAIMRYICKEFEVPNSWYPVDSKPRQRVDEYLEWHHINTRANCALYFRAKYLAPLLTGMPENKEKIQKLEKKMNQTLNELDNVWLKDKHFLVGSNITIADLVSSCEVEQIRMTGYDPCENRPHLAAWLKRVAAATSPHYQQAHKIVTKLAGNGPVDKLKSKM